MNEESRSWGRIWVILSICIGALILAGWYSISQAQTANVPAYEGASLAWEYPANVPHHSGFRLMIDGITGNTQIGKDSRQILLSDTMLRGQPLGKAYILRLIAVAAPPAVNSAPAVLTIDYQARPRLITPSNTRIILEWVP